MAVRGSHSWLSPALDEPRDDKMLRRAALHLPSSLRDISGVGLREKRSDRQGRISTSGLQIFRHCEASARATKQSRLTKLLDCFVVSLLAMTATWLFEN